MTDWQKGDLALCVNGRRISVGHTAEHGCPASGAIYTVDLVIAGQRYVDGKDGIALRFTDGPMNKDGTPTWAAHRFRRIPPHTADAEDVETIRLLTGEQVPA